MFGWSINLFRIRGIQLALHFRFVLLLAYAAYEGWMDGGWEQSLWSITTLVGFFACVVLHELGHSFTARHFGIGVRRILLMPIGGMAEFDSIPRQPSRELLITLAGPAVNFAIAALLWNFVGFGGDDYAADATGFAQLLLWANLVMGCFNLLPVFPMDGGRILRALLATRLSYLRATYWAATVGKVLALIAGVVAAFVFHRYLTAFLFMFIYAAGDAEYRAVLRREQEEAHWRAMARRFDAMPPVTEEPPVLGP